VTHEDVDQLSGEHGDVEDASRGAVLSAKTLVVEPNVHGMKLAMSTG